jgi:hypothetical protein
LIIERNQDADFAFASIAIILCCFVSFGLIFLPKILCIIRGRDQPLSTTGNKDRSTTNSAAGHGSNSTTQQLSSEDEEKHRKLVQENEQLKALIAEREARVNELIEKLKQRGSNIVIRDVQRFSGSATPGQTPANHDGDQTGTIDGNAYVMRRRSTFVNPITLSTRISNTALSSTATSCTGKTIEVPLEANNNNKRLSASSYRESVC